MKVAIVHDWFVGGGAEKVVEQFHKMFPEAPIYTSYATKQWQDKLNGKVVTGFLQKWPFSRLRKYVGVLRIWWFSHLDLSDFDVVISSSGNGEAKSVRTGKSTTHICYCHSPTHFYWRHHEDYLKNPGFAGGGFGLKALVKPLRKWDFKAAQKPDYFIANSTHIKNDIKKYYGRDSEVIHPPISTKRFNKNINRKRAGLITVGRLAPYKHTEIIIEVCSKLSLPLTVIGQGPELKKLKKLAGPTIKFDDNASDEAVNNYMQTAEAFIFAAFEDFGITPVEAMSAGTPVIAYKAGGALDYVVEGKTGMFFDKQNATSLMNTLERFQTKHFNHEVISKHAEEFSEENFRSSIHDFLKTRLDGF